MSLADLFIYFSDESTFGIHRFRVSLLGYRANMTEATWSQSEYFLSLEPSEQSRYKRKLTLSDGTTLPDPCSLKNDWKDDVLLLPDVSWPDVYNYLIDTPSDFTKESLKAYKSLEAYNFFLCGHVQDVFHHSIKKVEFCFIKSEVILRLQTGFNFVPRAPFHLGMFRFVLSPHL